MPFYTMLCHACNHEFEDFFSAKAPVPTLCPNCNVDGYVQRLIPSIVYARVPLTGQDLKQQIKKEAAQIKAQVSTNENLRANIVGEQKYEQHVKATEKLKETYKD